MSNGIKSRDDALREGVDSSNCSVEGFKQISEILSALAHFAHMSGAHHLETVAKTGIDVARTYLDLAECDSRRFESARTGVSHG